MTYCLKRKTKNDFFLFKVCLTSILQNSSKSIRDLKSEIRDLKCSLRTKPVLSLIEG
jgi:hypothetical protein